jgi:hypothetical protein
MTELMIGVIISATTRPASNDEEVKVVGVMIGLFRSTPFTWKNGSQ